MAAPTNPTSGGPTDKSNKSKTGGSSKTPDAPAGIAISSPKQSEVIEPTDPNAGIRIQPTGPVKEPKESEAPRDKSEPEHIQLEGADKKPEPIEFQGETATPEETEEDKKKKEDEEQKESDDLKGKQKPPLIIKLEKYNIEELFDILIQMFENIFGQHFFVKGGKLESREPIKKDESELTPNKEQSDDTAQLKAKSEAGETAKLTSRHKETTGKLTELSASATSGEPSKGMTPLHDKAEKDGATAPLPTTPTPTPTAPKSDKPAVQPAVQDDDKHKNRPGS
jgi:hypothetical protein